MFQRSVVALQPVAKGVQGYHVRSFSSNSDIVDKVKEFFIFNPKAKPYVNYAKTTEKTDKAYRTPSPMSRGTDIDVPVVENTDDLYDSQYYTRDVKRNARSPIYIISDEARKLLPTQAPEPTGSPGNKNPAVLRYDPEGTRSAMTTTQAALDSKLAKRSANCHVPQPWWAKDSASLKEESKAKGIPPLFGKPASWSKTEFDGKW